MDQRVAKVPASRVRRSLGHAILGPTEAALDLARDQEMIQLRQFERWGLLMGPADLLAWLVVWMAGGRPYHDNPFGRQADDEERRLRSAGRS